MLTADEIMAALSRPLAIEDTFTRVEGGKTFTYVSAEATIRWLNDIVGYNWSWVIDSYQVEPHPERTKSDKLQWMSVVMGTLSIYDPQDPENLLAARSGVGAGVNADPDTAVKTATAEALKKASNQYGVALYLWKQEGRDRIDALKDGSLPVLQSYLTEHAMREGIEANPEAIASYYGVTAASMRDVNVLKDLVEGAY
jgi:hypothetical protein